MIRPNDLAAWFQHRATHGRSELPQLVDGLQVGGQIVVGGAERNAIQANLLYGNQQRLGTFVSINAATLDEFRPTTFDTTAIVQLLMIARNETFHEVVNQTLDAIADQVERSCSIQVAIQAVRDQAAAVHRL